MYCFTLNAKLHLAPLHESKQILDVGTGTGIWAMEMAELYPQAQVTGTALSPIQPVELTPENCFFKVDDATLEWTWDEDYFDFPCERTFGLHRGLAFPCKRGLEVHQAWRVQ